MTETLDQWPAGETATMNVTYTQANAAGGAVVCEISPGAGNEFIVLSIHAINSGTNGVNAYTEISQGGGAGTILALLTNVASGAGTVAYLSVGTVQTAFVTTGNPTGLGYPVIVSGTQSLNIKQSGAGAQNDTFQILCSIRLKTGQVPTVTHANSTNPGNVTVTAGAESFTTV